VDGFELVQIALGTENGAARALYRGAGFETYGVERLAMRLGGRAIDEELMVLFL